MRRNKRSRKGLASIIGGLIIFSILLTVGWGFFYLESQLQQSLFSSSLNNESSSAQRTQEHILVSGLLLGAALGFSANNTGIISTIVSYTIIDRSTGQTYQFNSGTSSNPALPDELSQHQAVIFTTGVLYSSGHGYTIEILTSRGSVFVGTYPSKQLGTSVVSSLIAAGLGSLSMEASSYSLYSIPCSSSGPWSFSITQPEPAALIPSGICPVFSLQIINNDPNVGTIILNSHTDIYLYQSCPSGCGSAPLFSYFIVNVSPSGTITSTSQGSFVPISIPYGTNRTIYFASSGDLAFGSFQPNQIAQAHNVGLGEYDVFVIISGSNTNSQNSVLYSQNLPFAGSYLTTDVAYFSESPATCIHNGLTSFSLTVTNAQLSLNNVFNVTLISSLGSLQALAPNNQWNVNVGTGTIVWWSYNGGANGEIGPGSTRTFSWSGVAPSSIGTQTVFPIIITFNDGVTEQVAAGCFTT